MIIFAIIFAILGVAAFVGYLIYENPNQDAKDKKADLTMTICHDKEHCETFKYDACEQDIINLRKLIRLDERQSRIAYALFWLSIAFEFLSASMLFFAS